MFPVLFQIDYIVVHTYGVFLALALLGFLFGVHYFLRYTKQPAHFFQKHFLWLCLTFLLTAKISFILFTLPEFIARVWYFFSGTFSLGEIFGLLGYVISSGYSITAGIIGLLAYLWWICRKEGQSYYRWSDIISLGILLALAIAMIGAFFGGYYYGVPSDLPWAMSFESNSHSPIKYLSPIHPLQLYAFVSLVGGGFLLTRIFHYIKTPGILSTLTLCVYSVLFFLFEIIRGDSLPVGGLSMNQYLLIFLFVIGIGQGAMIARKHLR